MKYNPHNYQSYATEFIESHNESAILLSMGLGKTIITLTAINDLLFDSFDVRKVLIIAPLRVAKTTWKDEIQKWEHLSLLKYSIVVGNEQERLTSYQAQVDYYTKKIKANPEWEFVEVYTDEGISGTNTKKRDGFNRMIKDALEGKIDLIVTKSVSRFARNTVDSLTFIRKLKEKGVEVYFEKENIYTFDSKGELLITIMSSLAQEESRSISENVTWGIRKSFSDGKVSMPY